MTNPSASDLVSQSRSDPQLFIPFLSFPAQSKEFPSLQMTRLLWLLSALAVATPMAVAGVTEATVVQTTSPDTSVWPPARRRFAWIVHQQCSR